MSSPSVEFLGWGIGDGGWGMSSPWFDGLWVELREKVVA